MKNLVPIILIFVISYNVYSQDRKIKKIESLYMEEDWQNCKNKAEKYLEKNKKNPVLYFYSGFSYFNIYLNSSDKKKNSLLKSAAKAIQKGVKYDKSGDIHKKFEEISNKMQNTLKNTLIINSIILIILLIYSLNRKKQSWKLWFFAYLVLLSSIIES